MAQQKEDWLSGWNHCWQNLTGNWCLLDATLFPHEFCAVVGVCSGAVPLSGDRLGVQGSNDTKLLGNPM